MRDTKIHVAIPTFNRQEMLHRLMLHVMRDAGNRRVTVAVYDDCSRVPVRIPGAFTLPHRLVRFDANHGKTDYWALANRVFNDFRDTDADFLVYLADDLTLETGFFDRLIEAWRSLEDPAKGMLSYFYDMHRRVTSTWGGFEPVRRGRFWLTQWVDMAFLAPRATLERLHFEVLPVDPARWDQNPLLSSGVGQQLSRRVRKAGLNLYHLDRNLARHGTHESLMNPEARKILPLT